MVASIEDELNLSLLHRNKTGVLPTAACSELLPDIYDLIHSEKHLKQQADELRGLLHGTLRIGAYSSVAMHLLPDIIKRFHQLYPYIDIQLREGIYVELKQWLDSGKLDFCIYSGNHDENYDWIPLYKDPMLAILPLDHPLAAAKAVPIENFKNLPFIMPGSLGGGYDVVKLLDQFGISPDIKFSTIENYSALSMVSCGMGCSIMNEGITLGITSNCAKIPLDPPQYITIGIQSPSFKRNSPSAKKMIAFLRNSYPMSNLVDL